jgi:hypothetical protein
VITGAASEVRKLSARSAERQVHAGCCISTSENKGMKKVRDGRLRNTTNADASKEKGHKVGAASGVGRPPRFGSVTLRLLRSVLRKSGP